MASLVPELRTMLERQRQRLVLHEAGTRLGEDPEELHDFRVACTRLRALLRAARPVLVREWSEPLRGELGWLGDAVGSVRDLDVLIDHLKQEAQSFDEGQQTSLRPLFAKLDGERQQARARMLAALDSERYAKLLHDLAKAASLPQVLPHRLAASDLAAREFKRLRKAMRALPANPSDGELHRARIKGKRARYAAELAEPTVGKRARRFIRRAKKFQDTIGEHQDAVFAEQQLRAIRAPLGADSSTNAAIGILIELQEERRLEARRRLSAVWKKLKQSGKRAWQ